MASVTVDTKIFNALYTGSSVLTLNTTNAPWLSNVVKIIRPSIGTGINTRQSYNGAYNGATPGGAVTTLQPGLLYEITSGVTNNWVLPNFTRQPVLQVPESVTLIIRLPANQTGGTVQVPITNTDQSGTYAISSSTGLANLSYTKAGSPVTFPLSLLVNDTLIVTGTTSASDGILTLLKQ